MSHDLEQLLHKPLTELVAEYPMVEDFFAAHSLPVTQLSLAQTLDSLSPEQLGMTHSELRDSFCTFLTAILETEARHRIQTLDVLAGQDKSGQPESCNLLLKPGEVTCIVGPTGSGKSRLLADIEWLANKDTPTQRTVLLNGKLPDDAFKDAHGGKLVAQITQNMNFVLDMQVHDFLMMHAQSRYLENAADRVAEVIETANELAGEPFEPTTPVTFLSGGQSRALMIADVACIGQAPIVLIDEIENAGTDKRKALELLVQQDKIVLMATHDPLLILQADWRVVIRNGGMSDIHETNEYEKEMLQRLEAMDTTLQQARAFFRSGQCMTSREDQIRY